NGGIFQHLLKRGGGRHDQVSVFDFIHRARIKCVSDRLCPEAAFQVAKEADFGGTHSGPLYPCIRSNRMPSRTPRSATRRRPTGQVAQIASRMAQPLSTKSARSRPTQGLAARPAMSRPARWRDTSSIWSKVSMLPSTIARI